MPPWALFLENIVSWSVLYSSLILAMMLWCTILIIYHILRVGGATGRIHVYQRVIEMLIESALLYSTVIVTLLVFEVRNEIAGVYISELAIAMRVSTSNLSCLFSVSSLRSSLLGNHANNSSRLHCSRTYTPRRFLEQKHPKVITSIQKSFKFIE